MKRLLFLLLVPFFVQSANDLNSLTFGERMQIAHNSYMRGDNFLEGLVNSWNEGNAARERKSNGYDAVPSGGFFVGAGSAYGSASADGNRILTLQEVARFDHQRAEFARGETINGVSVRGLTVNQRVELAKQDQKYDIMANNFDVNGLNIERHRLKEMLASPVNGPSDKYFLNKSYQLLNTYRNSPQISDLRTMIKTEDSREAKSSYEHFKWMYTHKMISPDKFAIIEREYFNRPEMRELTRRIQQSCDYLTTDACTRAHFDMNHRLNNQEIVVPTFEGAIDWSEVTRYINAHIAQTSLMAFHQDTITAEQWGALNAEAMADVMRPFIKAAAGTAHGSANAALRPIFDIGKGVVNITIETLQKSFNINAETPMWDAYEKWRVQCYELYEKDPYQAGYNFGGKLTTAIMPFVSEIKGLSKVQVKLFKQTLSTCKNIEKSSESACVVM